MGILLAVLTVVPGVFAGALLSEVGLPPQIAWSPLLALTVYCASHFAHELGHTVAATFGARTLGIDPALVAAGGFRRASVIGASLGREGDALVSLAGPALGLATAMPLLIPGGPFLLRAPFLLLFATHLLELRPTRADGAALWSAIAPRGTRC